MNDAEKAAMLYDRLSAAVGEFVSVDDRWVRVWQAGVKKIEEKTGHSCFLSSFVPSEMFQWGEKDGPEVNYILQVTIEPGPDFKPSGIMHGSPE